jgi:myo-inositol-1-phosphate synthase
VRTGIWLIGARGSVATTAITGAAAIRGGFAEPNGCVSELEPFAGLGLPAFDELVFGGHDVAETPLTERAEQLVGNGVLPTGLPALVRADLEAADAEIRRVVEDGRGQAEVIDGLVADLESFRERTGVARIVVVNVASTEPFAEPDPACSSLDSLRAELAAGRSVLPYSSAYAYAAFRAGCAFVDFTPSVGARIPALDEFARENRLPYAGSDGKTGETLLKSVLAPMFAQRALRVRSWSGTNLLGGGDGAALAEPERAKSKIDSKQRLLEEELGYAVDGGVHIHNVPALGDWKTAWDHIAFDGFLGTRMSMQFTWQGCDSALAAPLVLDLARFAALAHAHGIGGPLDALAFFFKDPVGTSVHALGEQFTVLRTWADELRSSS